MNALCAKHKITNRMVWLTHYWFAHLLACNNLNNLWSTGIVIVTSINTQPTLLCKNPPTYQPPTHYRTICTICVSKSTSIYLFFLVVLLRVDPWSPLRFFSSRHNIVWKIRLICFSSWWWMMWCMTPPITDQSCSVNTMTEKAPAV